MDAVYRASAKVLMVDPLGRVLLFRGSDPAKPEDAPVWFAVGGGVEAGETVAEAAVREVQEETGQVVTALGPVVLTRRFHWTFAGILYDQEETYFLVRTPHFELDTAGWTDLERRAMTSHRWWSIDELRDTEETVYPVGLTRVLEENLDPRPAGD